MTIQLGSTFTYRVAPGRIAVCRAIGTRDRYTALVGSAWEGPTGTTFEAMRRSRRFHTLQWLTHHNWKHLNPRHVVGEWSLVPAKGLRFIGVAEVTAAERACLAEAMVVGSFALQGKLQWRWDHERTKVRAEDRKAKLAEQKQERAARVEASRERAKLRKAGPRALLRGTWFSDFRPKKKRDACRALIRELVTSLVAHPREVERITQCMRDFNALDGKHGHRFDTPDAEQLVDALYTVAIACGMSEAKFDRDVDANRDF